MLDWTNAPAFPWTNLQFTVTASDSETVLQLGFDNGDAFGLDDISVRPAVMPQPAMGGVHASFAGFAINVNNSVAGATYYLLSSTNLVRPLAQWIVVATNCPDGNGGFVIVLPNAISPIPGRFYILGTHQTRAFEQVRIRFVSVLQAVCEMKQRSKFSQRRS